VKASAAPLETFCLGVLLTNPELLYRIDRQLQSLGEGRLSGEDFASTERQLIFDGVRSALAQDDEEPARHVILSLEETLSELAQVLQQGVGELNLDRPDVLEEVISNFLRLRKRTLESRLQTLQMQQQSSQGESSGAKEGLDEKTKGLMERVRQTASQKDRLDRALSRHLGAPDLSTIGQGLIG
jgi:hypothetical protein